MSKELGIQWPEITDKTGKKSRSSTTTATQILSQALLAHGSPESKKLSDECKKQSTKSWRFGYQKYFMELTRLMAESSPDTVCKMSQAGIQAAYDQFDFIAGKQMKINDIQQCQWEGFQTGCVQGQGTSKKNQIPYKNKIYENKEIESLLNIFVTRGQMEKSVFSIVSESLQNNPDFNLSDYYFVLIGATSEMGPFEYLVDHGANVIAIARQGEDKWQQLINRAQKGSGRMYIPLSQQLEESKFASVAGADVLTQAPQITQWLSTILPDKKLYIHSLIYLDGEKNVRASVGMDFIVNTVNKNRKNGTGLIYIDTPSHVVVVPAECQTKSSVYYKNSPIWQKIFLKFGILKRNKYFKLQNTDQYVLMNCLAGFQGPNYALAKLMQKWRAILARFRDGQFVSINTGPPALTQSVIGSATVAKVAPYYSLFRPNDFYEPKTASTILAIMMSSDILNKKSLSHPGQNVHPLHFIAEQSWHGGGWNSPYDGDSTGTGAFIIHLLKKFAPLFIIILSCLAYYVIRK